MAPDGNNKDHIQVLRNKAEHWASSIQACHTNKDEIWNAMHHTIPYSICYSLPAVTLTKAQCRHIVAPIFKIGLPRAGVPATIPREIRYGPLGMGGLGFRDPYIHMGVSQIESLISNTWKQNPTGKLMDIALDDLVMELGLLHPLHPQTLKLGLQYATTDSWIKHVMQFMLDHQITIQTNTNWIMPQRVNDITLMDAATNMITHVPTLQSMNKVRMLLNVVWMSDIATADGTLGETIKIPYQESVDMAT